VTPARLRTAIESADLTVEHWADLTSDAGAMMRAVMSGPPTPLGLQAFVPDFATKVGNLIEAMAAGRLHVIQAIARPAAH
jgi:hypothetical protein